ncbi:hypothetical protein [Ramlibacter sp. Leaf400]|uniref:hypothetical protein n=1 Tax=Ramlibacter sp. Leaf400 TaxID=1736365 RepID=UPI000700A24B|nr:hypothetical protein [Ramlibacter sp. Leaf400]KQT13498.1 hypothetical protein ASG30_18900 [Ramlibacter sp. Leaf400]
MRPRILFVVMSAVAAPGTVEQLALSLAPHTVLLHHDFSQSPDFRVEAQNVAFVPEPVRTGWGTFGFVEGIFHALDHAVRHHDFDYLQLLSPTCLPIKPLSHFEAHVAQPVDAHFGAIDLMDDQDCLMSVGYRAFTPADTFRHRVLRRLTAEYFARRRGRRDESGVWIHSGGGVGWKARLARWTVRAAAHRALGPHPFGPGLRPYYGSVWFGARPHVVRGMVEAFRQPELRTWFSRLRIAEEFLVPTLLMRLAGSRGPLNHYISRFDQAHPHKLRDEDLDELRVSPAFFARKFPDDPQAQVRWKVLGELVGAEDALAETASRGRVTDAESV